MENDNEFNSEYFGRPKKAPPSMKQIATEFWFDSEIIFECITDETPRIGEMAVIEVSFTGGDQFRVDDVARIYKKDRSGYVIQVSLVDGD
jgi:hypothetical protein